MSGVSAAGSETGGGNGVSNQLASLVPTFDPAVDDVLIYQQKVELVYAAWPKARTTELVTRLILGCKGSAFQKLQIYQAELLDGSEKSVHRVVELLGGQWGRIPLQRQYQDAERAIFETIQRSGESNDSFLARADVLWSRLLARKMSLEDLQAYILLRGSQLSTEEKKKIILESEAAGKLSVTKVTEVIRTLGASFFQDMTNQKKSTRSKVYDQEALLADATCETEETDSGQQVSEDLTEEEYLEQLASEGDADAVLVADFELAAQDTIQEDSELAVTLTAYQQARHRLAERFRNRGFFPSRPFSGGKGKGFGSKGGKGKSPPPWQNRPRKTLQERIMSSTCRLCNQKGHWKAECPYRGQNAAAASSSGGGSTAPTTAVTFDQDVDSLPLEFLTIPEEVFEHQDLDHESQQSPSQCFVSCATNGRDKFGYHNVIHREYKGGIQSIHGNPLHVTAHDRLRQHLRSGVSRETCDSSKVPGRSHTPQCQTPHFAEDAKRASVDPVSRTRQSEPPPQCVLFATHSTYGVLDLGASKTVIGSNHVAELIGGLDEVIRSKLTRVKCSITFKFGNEGTLQSQHALVIPIGPLKLKIAIVEGGTPFLVSNTLMRALRATIDCQARTVASPMLCKSIPLSLTSRGLFLIDINQMALAALQSPAKMVPPSSSNQDTFVTTDAKSESMMSVMNNGDAGVNHNQQSGSNYKGKTVYNAPKESCPTEAKEMTVQKSAQSPAVNDPKVTLAATAQDRKPDRDANSAPVRPLHVAVQPLEEPSTGGSLKPERPVAPVVGRLAPGKGGVRGEAPGQDLSGGMEDGSELDPVCSRPLQQESQDGTSSTDPLHRVDARSPRGAAIAHPCGSECQRVNGDSSSPRPKANGEPYNRQSQGKAIGPAAIHEPGSHRNSFARHGRRGLGDDFRSVPPWVYASDPIGARSQFCCSAESSPEHGKCIDSSDCSLGAPGQLWPDGSAGGSACSAVTTDDIPVEASSVHPDVNLLWKHVRKLQSELDHVKQSHHAIGKPFLLAEVFCSKQSPLTHQAHQLGARAFRFGLEDGDLSTPGGRGTLFKRLVVHQPQHLWYSPVCGPWSSWSQFNSTRTSSSPQEYLEKREAMLYQIALGIVLYRHQVQNGRHLHWEQPARSLMFHQPGISEIHQFTRSCQFDQCEVGNLVDPHNGAFMKKGMTVITTSPAMYKSLHGRTCRRNHAHQPIEGSTWVRDQRVRRSTFTEVYPRKFARLVAQTMIKSPREWPFNWNHGLIALTQSEPAVPTLTAGHHRVIQPSRPKATFVKSELMYPPNKVEQVIKRRRLAGKQHVGPCLEDCQEVLNRISRMMPRVGKREITESDILQPIQQMFSDKVVVSVVACRGTDRTMGPPSNLHAHEAPFRKTLMILRPSSQVAHEVNWERWTQLSHRQLIRPAHPCRLNVTVFARDREATARAEQPADPPADAAGPMEGHDCSSSSHEIRSASLSQSPHHEINVDPMDAETRPNSTEVTPDISDESQQPGPLHEQTPRVTALPKWEQNQLFLMHRNLGHPSNERLSKALQASGHRAEVINAARELRCKVCAQNSAPKHQRPGQLKPIMDFNHKVYMDGISWKNQQGKEFHFYHMLDAGTNFHVAFVAPSRHTQDVIQLINQHWICWAGAPSKLVVDAGTEFCSEEFMQFTQRFSIQCTSNNPEAHWQNGKIERHGKFLQEMLRKIDTEMPVQDYNALQMALNQSTQSKNNLSVRHGYSPEIIVFGKQSRLPGSILSDESIPSHLSATQEMDSVDPNSFKRHLQLREVARKAFHAADNNDALRRSLLRRSCPDRGVYHPGQWVMIWRTQNLNQPMWIGPQRVILQDANHTIWTTQAGRLYRSAPEHVRRSLPSEGEPEGPELPVDLTMIQRQIDRLSNMPGIPEEDAINLDAPGPADTEVGHQSSTHERGESTSESSQQPDQEPETISHDPSHASLENDNEVTEEIQQLLCCESADAFAECSEQGFAFRCEFDVPIPASHQESDLTNADPWIFLVSGAAKQRTEVRMSELNQLEKSEFEKAKQSEINNWLQTETISKVLKHQIPAEQVLKCRWILTWKPIDGVNQDEVHQKSLRTHKPKARLVVLGYQDPKIDEIPRDSPTLNKTSRMLILQTISSHAWQLMSFDIKAAFLQGQPQEGRTMGLDPVPELRRAMNMSPHEIGKLNKSAYGLIDAPYLWYCALTNELIQLGMEMSPFDPCTFILRDKQKPQQISGILGIHVDDGVGGGNAQFHELLDKLEQKYKFGAKKVGSFTFTGVELTQKEDYSIILSQSSYVKKINAIKVETNRKTQPDLPVTEEERGSLRGLVGSLQYAAVNTRPDLSSRLSSLQSAINHATIDTLLEANRLLHEAKKYHDVTITIRPIPYKNFRFMAFSDASFASHKKPESHAGVIIVGTHQEISNNIQCPISPISWGSKKIQKVVTSTLAAETTSLASALDQLAWLRLFWKWIHDPRTDWKNPEAALLKTEPAITVPTLHEHQDIAVTDCKSLYDLVTRTAPPNCSEFRTQLVARAIKDALKENVTLRWVHSGAQLADCLTKAMQSHFLRETLRVGSYRLHDEDATLKNRAKTRDRIRWLQQADGETEPQGSDQFAQHKDFVPM